MEGTLAEIRMFGGNYAPLNWSFCQGQLLSIADNNQALFSLLGVTYGGNGTTNFQLPDFRGRTPIGSGYTYKQGDMIGTEECTLTVNNLPPHEHTITFTSEPNKHEVQLNAKSGRGSLTNEVTGNYPGKPPGSLKIYNTTYNHTMAPFLTISTPVTTGETGGGQPFNIMQPYIAVHHIICTNSDTYPSRN